MSIKTLSTFALLLFSSTIIASPCSKQDAINTLAFAAYHEARNQDERGMQAVMEVILHRVESPYWPDDVCKVVWEASNHPIDNPEGCAFSFTCTDVDLATRDTESYKKALDLAEYMWDNGLHYSITHYSTGYVKCNIRNRVGWTRRAKFTVRIGNHCFYRENDRSVYVG